MAQASTRAWYNRIEAYFMKEVFEKCDYEHTLFIKTNKEGKVLIHEFDMTDLGKMRYFLGLEVLQKSDDKTYYKQVVGSLMYLTATQPYLMFVVSIISRKGGDDELVAYTDSDYAGDLEDRKSTSDQNQSRSCVIQCDSSSAIKLLKNPVMHGRIYCDTQEQLADIMTKPLKLNTFVKLRGQLGVCSETNVN
ncbi:hypothetical protein CK203_110489 [Vitis vinifera]|uniref:Reverse transcriptase Ty1/copia-type domain-containing protein n=1 Tax=Vitis vinifera TaxID=29760 RepID=A0A438C5A7_VITVI|nr:hypothetical protein CK203_110489 [Vitis vinifera]